MLRLALATVALLALACEKKAGPDAGKAAAPSDAAKPAAPPPDAARASVPDAARPVDAARPADAAAPDAAHRADAAASHGDAAPAAADAAHPAAAAAASDAMLARAAAPPDAAPAPSGKGEIVFEEPIVVGEVDVQPLLDAFERARPSMESCRPRSGKTEKVRVHFFVGQTKIDMSGPAPDNAGDPNVARCVANRVKSANPKWPEQDDGIVKVDVTVPPR
jgi:hypothetical protein